MSAYACEPNKGSEQEVGWRWAFEISKECDVTVITRSNSRPLIEQWQREHPGKMHANFIYLDLGRLSLWAKKSIPGGLYIYYAIWQWKLRWLTHRLLKREAFDIHHHVTFASFRLPVGLVTSPMVWGPVGGAEKAPTKLLAGQGTPYGRLREHLRNLATETSKLTLKLTCPMLRKTSGIALASTLETKRILEHSGLDVIMMPTIGYDSSSVSTTYVRKTRDNLNLLYVGRLHLLKGVHLLLQAVAVLKAENIRLSIVGLGPEEDRLMKLSQRLNITDMVNFKGKIPHNELSKVYLNHDVLMAPSLYESGGLSILEGFAHGLPAVALDCGGPALSITDGCGFRIRSDLTQNDTVHAIANAIQSYIDSPELVEKHGKKAREHLKNAYGWNRKRIEMLTAYRQLLNEHGPKDHEQS